MKKKEFPKVTVILRGYDYDQVNSVMEVLADKGEHFAVEVTLNSPDVFETIKRVADQFGESLFIGAGTVLDLEDAKKAIEAGAQFILSPIMLEKETFDYCKERGIKTIPAGMTPTEVYQLFQNGADIVKLFPATSMELSHFKAMKGPLGELPLMAVGGVNSHNTNDFLDGGASYVGIASGIFNKEDILSKNKSALTKSLEAFEERVFHDRKAVSQ